MKRSFGDGEVVDDAMDDDMANCLMLLSKVGQSDTPSRRRVFECKTCNRQFPSFQALGGHRASHKRPRLLAGDLFHHHDQLLEKSSDVPPKEKTHECSICGVEFKLGQALGGHMRRHRVATTTSVVVRNNHDDHHHHPRRPPSLVPVLKKSNSSKRVLCLDLNLMPWENDLKLQLGKSSSSPMVN